MRRKAAIGVLFAASISTVSCSPFGGLPNDGRPVGEVYRDVSGAGGFTVLRMKDSGSPLGPELAVPVIYPAEIFPAYVPTHVDPERDMMVGEHFLFIKLRESAWLSEKDYQSDLKVDGVAPAEELRILAGRLPKALWEKAVVPYKPPTPSR
jgi:hypothetical protein